MSEVVELEEAERRSRELAGILPPRISPPFTGTFIRSATLFDEYVLRLTLGIFRATGLAKAAENPGTTDELLLPTFEKLGLKVGEDFFLCFSPERVDPGNPIYQTSNTPKVVGGVTPACTEMGRLFFSQALDTVVPVSNTRVAEMVKLLENTFRAVNIGLVNEIALMCEKLGIDAWEVIDAAKTKPFGFMPFYPGPGLGGHCIPIDPFYLSWKARQNGFECRFIELAGHVNSAMPEHVV